MMQNPLQQEQDRERGKEFQRSSVKDIFCRSIQLLQQTAEIVKAPTQFEDLDGKFDMEFMVF